MEAIHEWFSKLNTQGVEISDLNVNLSKTKKWVIHKLSIENPILYNCNFTWSITVESVDK